MQQVQLPGTSMTVSRLALGTASLLNGGSAKRREAILHAALDAGFTHFDTAPLYGFGVAEKDLGRVLRGRTDCTVATKVGLRSPGGDDQWPLMAVARKALGRLSSGISAARTDFSLDWARRSLEGSLRRLRRERIDLYLLHEPQLALLDQDAWLRWLEDVRHAGKVRHFGLAALPERVIPFLERGSGLCEVLQLADSVPGHEADVVVPFGRKPQLTFGYIKGSPSYAPADAIKAGLMRNRDGAVIYSTRKPERLAAMARLAE